MKIQLFGSKMMKVGEDSLKGKCILQVLPSLDFGGVTQGTIDIAKAILAQKGRALVAAYAGPRTNELINTGAEFISLPLHRKNPFSLIYNSLILMRVIQKNNVNLVHARSRSPAWSAFWAACLTHTPFVTTFHGTYNFKPFVKKWYNSVMVRGDRVIAISNFIHHHIQTHYQAYLPPLSPEPTKMHDFSRSFISIIPRGIDLDRFDPHQVSPDQIKLLRQSWGLTSQRPVFLFPGRLTRWKGQMIALQAFLYLKKPWALDMVFLGAAQGRLSYQAELVDFISKHHLQDHVKVVENYDHMPTAYALAEGVIHASIEPEAFGRVVAEAQAMGKPIVATTLGAPEEIILNQKTGWLIPPRDPQALACALETMLHLSLDEKIKLAQQARARIKRYFSLDQMCAQTLAVYGELLVKNEISPSLPVPPSPLVVIPPTASSSSRESL